MSLICNGLAAILNAKLLPTAIAHWAKLGYRVVS